LDVRKWDIHTLASFLSSVARSFLPFFKLQPFDNYTKAFVAVFLRVIECHKFKVFNCPSGGGWYAVASSMMSGSWDTSFMNTMCNVVAFYMVVMEIKPGFFDLPNWRDHVTVKAFGDDQLSMFSRKHGDGRVDDGMFTEDELKAIPGHMKRMFRYEVPLDDFKIHTRLFSYVLPSGKSWDRSSTCSVHPTYSKGCQSCFGLPSKVEFPTFLKFQWVLVPCKYCSDGDYGVAHWAFARESFKVLPKLFVDSVKPLTIKNFQAKIFGYAHTVGSGLSTYAVLSEVWDIVKESHGVVFKHSDFSEDLDHRFGLDYRYWLQQDLQKLPTWYDMIRKMVCPSHYAAMPMSLSVKRYENWHDYTLNMKHVIAPGVKEVGDVISTAHARITRS
jgi:hypothetical protein